MGRNNPKPWQPLVPTANLVAGLLAASGAIALIQAIQVSAAFSGVTDMTVPIGQLGVRLQDQISPAPLGGIVSLLTLGTGVTWLIWQHRAQKDLHARALPDLKYTPGWAVGWWFVPLANLVMPYLCVRELWDGAGRTPGARATDHRDWKLLTWWLTYMAASYLLLLGFVPVFGAIFRSISDQAASNGSTRITSITLSAASIHTAQLWTIAGDIMRAVAAGFAVWLVLAISRREDASGGVLFAPAIGLPWPPPMVPPRPDM